MLKVLLLVAIAYAWVSLIFNRKCSLVTLA